MHIRLKLEGRLKELMPENAEFYQIDDGATLLDLMVKLGIAKGDVVLAFVDGSVAQLKTCLIDGKAVTLCPMLCGG